MQIVINTRGTRLHKDGERFLIQAGEKKLALSAHKIQSIVLATAATIATDAIVLAVANNIDLIFLDSFGNPITRIWPPRLGSTAAIRRRQLEIADTPAGLAFVRDWVAAKLRHQREFLDELHSAAESTTLFDGPLTTIANCSTQLETLAGVIDGPHSSIMGLEGSAGRAYFTCIGQLVPEAYRFTGRSRQPAQDAFNAMLNYSYGVLHSLVEKACICAGLDPYIGFLHTDNYGKKSLVFDLMEPFRILGDRATLLIFTGRRAEKDFFEPVPGGIALSKEGRAFFLSQYNERLDKTIRYPVQGKPGRTRNIKQRDVIQHEAHALANALLGRRDMPRVLETRILWHEENSAAPPSPDDLAEDDTGEEPCLPG